MFIFHFGSGWVCLKDPLGTPFPLRQNPLKIILHHVIPKVPVQKVDRHPATGRGRPQDNAGAHLLRIISTKLA